MQNIILFFIPVIALIGIITSYTDIKKGKIANKWIIFGITYFLLTTLFLLVNKTSLIPNPQNYILNTIINLTLAILISFLLYYYDLWNAGDGKLFICFSSLIPIIYFTNIKFTIFPSLSILINTFFISFLLFLPRFIKKVKLKDLLKSSIKTLLNNLKPLNLAQTILMFFSITWITGNIMNLLNLNNNSANLMLLTYPLFFIIKKQIKHVRIYLILAFLRLIFDKNIYSFDFLISLGYIILFFQVLSIFFSKYFKDLIEQAFLKNIKIDKLEPGMTLYSAFEHIKNIKDEEYKKLKKHYISHAFQIGKDCIIIKPKDKVTHHYIREKESGLTESQIKKIKALNVKNIIIHEKTPFAYILFLGVILTILSKGNVLILLLNLLFPASTGCP
jgi:Flp pilus assembly protein protease CpaA